ncbi:hypothetical protein FVEN_g13050 [Fusarium venenatum]|nr:hypothetical protein FVEN_g13050 [Fusarium venenatum]
MPAQRPSQLPPCPGPPPSRPLPPLPKRDEWILISKQSLVGNWKRKRNVPFLIIALRYSKLP